MRQVWQQSLAGELGERQPALTSAETDALSNMARSPEEGQLMRKVRALIERRHR